MPQTLGVRRKYRIRRFFGSRVAFVIVLILLVIFTQAAVGMYAKAKESRLKRDLAMDELRRLEERETDLQTEISRLSSPRGIEEELRDRYFVAKEGEKVAVIRTEETQSGSAQVTKPDMGFWKSLLSAIGLSVE